MAYRKIREGDAQVMAILRVESGVVNEIYAATDHIAGGKSWSVGLTGTTWAETVAIITVVTVRMLIPTGKSIYVDAWGREADAHVTVTSLAYDLHLEVVQAAGSRYRVRCTNTSSVFVGFAVTWKNNTAPTLFKGIGESDDYSYRTKISVARRNMLKIERERERERETHLRVGCNCGSRLKPRSSYSSEKCKDKYHICVSSCLLLQQSVGYNV